MKKILFISLGFAVIIFIGIFLKKYFPVEQALFFMTCLLSEGIFIITLVFLYLGSSFPKKEARVFGRIIAFSLFLMTLLMAQSGKDYELANHVSKETLNNIHYFDGMLCIASIFSNIFSILLAIFLPIKVPEK